MKKNLKKVSILLMAGTLCMTPMQKSTKAIDVKTEAENMYTVIYNANGGVLPSGKYTVTGSSITITSEIPERKILSTENGITSIINAKFLGWYDQDGNRIESGKKISSNLMLTARWETSYSWNPSFATSVKNAIVLSDEERKITKSYKKFKKPVKLWISTSRISKIENEEYKTKFEMQYQIVSAGEKDISTAYHDMPKSTQPGLQDYYELNIKNHTDCVVYFRAIDKSSNISKVFQTTGFSVDTSAPTVKGVKNNSIHKKAVHIRVNDTVSGTASIKLNGKLIKTNIFTVKKKGVYKLVVKDKVGHKRVVKFAIC